MAVVLVFSGCLLVLAAAMMPVFVNVVLLVVGYRAGAWW